jgi:hypothetical protein
LEHFHKRLRCGAATVENSSIQQSKWQRQHNQRQLCKLAAALQQGSGNSNTYSMQQGAKQGKANKAAASNNAKEHTQQQLKRNWEASDTSLAPWFYPLNM